MFKLFKSKKLSVLKKKKERATGEAEVNAGSDYFRVFSAEGHGGFRHLETHSEFLIFLILYKF